MDENEQAVESKGSLIPKQNNNECMYCYLQRLIVEGVEVKIINARRGRYRRVTGKHVWIGGRKIKRIEREPKNCECHHNQKQGS